MEKAPAGERIPAVAARRRAEPIRQRRAAPAAAVALVDHHLAVVPPWRA